ncbi:MAG: 3-hydroxybutyrate dehydrogenase [Hyphomicrobiales bacterium]|nr:3-hydroxybutyrate dehydrogenase [Hyphomicrobiales bacterium]
MALLKGKTALVTGSTSGIGQGVAEALAREGCHIMLNGFGDAAAIEVQRSGLEKQYGIKALYSGADMRNPAAIHAMVEEAEKQLGGVDVLVNNAGIQHVAPVDEFPEEKWDAIMAINLSSAFHTVKAVAPGMRQKGWGRIINIASVHGLVASAYKVAYVAAKHGILGLTKVVALDLAEAGVTCNAICPGYVRTPLVEKQIPDQAKTHGISEAEVIEKVLLKNHAVKQFVEVADVAALVCFLCSDAAKTMTGVALPMDGGWSAQ